MEIKAYHGYGHTHNLVLFGHVFSKKPAERTTYSNNILSNIVHLLRLFLVRPLGGVPVRLLWADQLITAVTESDGFFKFEWKATHEIPAGWHAVTVEAMDTKNTVRARTEGLVFVPHSTQFAFISDIDDTIMVSHSATIRKRLVELFVKNPRTRDIFPGVADHYSRLAAAHTLPQSPNPFFYVSSSEWNLYDYLHEFFDHNNLPKGSFLLNQVKRWYQLLKTGKTRHDGKLLRIMRILHAFPRQRFILFGDNTQSDPEIYALVASRMPGRIYAVYIRNVVPAQEVVTQQRLHAISEAGVHTCLFFHSEEALVHSREIGLID